MEGEGGMDEGQFTHIFLHIVPGICYTLSSVGFETIQKLCIIETITNIIYCLGRGRGEGREEGEEREGEG